MQKLRLDNFERQIDEEILDEGFELYLHNLEEVYQQGATYYARIATANSFEVNITFSAEDEVIDYSCSCGQPAGVCVHVCALLYEVDARNEDAATYAIAEEYQRTLLAKLGKQTPTELIEIIFNLTRDDFHLAKRVLGDAEPHKDAAYLLKTIDEYIAKYEFQYEAAEGIDLVLEWIDESNDETVRDLYVLTAIYLRLLDLKTRFEEEVDNYQGAYASPDDDFADDYDDDADGYYLRATDEDRDDDYDEDDEYADEYDDNHPRTFYAFPRLPFIIEKLHKKIADFLAQAPGECKELEANLKTVFNYERFDLEDEAVTDLLLVLRPLAKFPKIYKMLLKAVKDSRKYNTRLYEFVPVFYYDYQFSLISDYGNSQELTDFIIKHLEYPAYRLKVMEDALNDKDYKTLINLGEDGLLLREEFPLQQDVITMLELLSKGYEKLGQKVNLQNTLFLLLMYGQDKYYEAYKKTFADDEWREYYPYFKQKIMGLSQLMFHVLVSENAWQEVLEIVTKAPDSIHEIYQDIPHTYYPTLFKVLSNELMTKLRKIYNVEAMLDLDESFLLLRKLGSGLEFLTFLDAIRKEFTYNETIVKYVDSIKAWQA